MTTTSRPGRNRPVAATASADGDTPGLGWPEVLAESSPLAETFETFPAGQPSLLGYARVSTGGQRADRQVEALAAAGCGRVWTDAGISGTRTSRPGLDALLAYARPGDVIVVTELSRLGRTVRGLVELVDDLARAGVGVRSLTQGVDTSGDSAVGTLLLSVFAALAQIEREVLVERTRDGLESARRRGVRLGRPPALSPEQAAEATAMVRAGRPVAEVARLFGVGRATIRRSIDLEEAP